LTDTFSRLAPTLGKGLTKISNCFPDRQDAQISEQLLAHAAAAHKRLQLIAAAPPSGHRRSARFTSFVLQFGLILAPAGWEPIAGLLQSRAMAPEPLPREIAAIERPTAGSIVVNGQNLAALRDGALPYLRRNFGLIFQDQKLLFDRSALDNIRALDASGASAVLERVIAIYLKSAPQLVHAMHDAEQAGDALELGKAAHSLKSSSLNVGATRLGTLCREIEAAAKADPVAAPAALATAGARPWIV